tara:strand:+ start:254 stop:421 length:168 start_codon:yes stop_codon:yes gene_type:complete
MTTLTQDQKDGKVLSLCLESQGLKEKCMRSKSLKNMAIYDARQLEISQELEELGF